MSNIYAPPASPIELIPANGLAYAGLWRRLAALVLDTIVVALTMYLLSLFAAPVQNLAIAFVPLHGFSYYFYTSYLHGKSGQTLGKRLLKIRVLRRNGDRIGFARSARRNILMGIESVPWVVASMIALSSIPDNQYLPLQAEYLQALELSLRPAWYDTTTVIVGVVIFAEWLSCLVTTRKQSLSDLIADTVVVDAEYAGKEKSHG